MDLNNLSTVQGHLGTKRTSPSVRPEVTDTQKTPRTNRSYLPSRWCGVSGLSASPVTENTYHNTHYGTHVHYTLKMPVAVRIIIHTHTVYLKQSFRTVSFLSRFVDEQISKERKTVRQLLQERAACVSILVLINQIQNTVTGQ